MNGIRSKYIDARMNFTYKFERPEAVWPKPSTPEQQYLISALRYNDLNGARSLVKRVSFDIRRQIIEDPFLMLTAVKLNNPNVIRFLVEECNAKLNIFFNWSEEYSTRFDHLVHTVFTPLHYAANSRHAEAAVELVRLGAKVNSFYPTTGFTPLHHACQNGTLSIVRELIQHGADITMTTKCGYTPLMLAASHVDVCRFLIDSGAEVKAVNKKSGETALHRAAIHQNTETVKLLIRNGADIFKKDCRGEDALRTACVGLATDIVKFMIDQVADDDVRHKTLIWSHQLLGACYIQPSVYRQTNRVCKVLTEWEAAIRLCNERPHVDAGEDKIASVPNAAYDNAEEVDSMPKLNDIRYDLNKIFMQSLLLKEKILGQTHHVTFVSVMKLAEFFTRSKDFGRGLRLLTHGFRLLCGCRLTPHNTIVFRDYMIGLRQIETVFNTAFKMQDIDFTDNFKDVYEFLETVTLEARTLGPPAIGEKGVTCFHGEENTCFTLLGLYLIQLYCLLKKNEVQSIQFKKLVRNFVQVNIRSFEGRTLLMNAICRVSPTGYSYISLQVDVVKLLLECGADTGETDYNGNSVLHLLATSQFILKTPGDVPDKEKVRHVIEMLLVYGAHFDAKSKDGFSSVHYLSFLGLELSTHMTLQCLAAKVIRRHRIPYEGILPKSLADFVQMH